MTFSFLQMFITSEVMKKMVTGKGLRERDYACVNTIPLQTLKKITDHSHLPEVEVTSLECTGWCVSWGGVENILCVRRCSFNPPQT